MSSDSFLQQRGIPYDDQAMQQHMRALALRETPDGSRPLHVPPPEALQNLHRAARELCAQQAERSEELDWVLQNARVLESLFAAQTRAPRHALPASGRQARIQTLMDELVRHSDALITGQRLEQALLAYDEVRALRMDELWAAPCALSGALLHLYGQVCQSILEREEERREAERWVEQPSLAPVARGGAFFERALKKLHEQELPGRRHALERLLRGASLEELLRVEREKTALSLLLLNNLLATLRLLEGLDYAACF